MLHWISAKFIPSLNSQVSLLSFHNVVTLLASPLSISIPEFNTICPKTGLPDFGIIYIRYVPNKFIVELKSLKLYIVGFRNFGIFHEHVTNKIMDDFKKACSPHEIEVRGDFNPRGGIKTAVEAKI